jgi:Uma2 family endonuclease
MDTLILDPQQSQRLLAERHARGLDRFDEVWEGVYVMAPAPNDEHQDVGGGFTEVLRTIIDREGLGKARPGINLAGDPDDWQQDFRVPDLAVFLNDSPAVCHGAFWSGAPDFVVEIISPFDKTREKLDFYSRLGTRELLIVDRDPWRLELYRLQAGTLTKIQTVAPGDASLIQSAVLPLSLRLIANQPRPTIEIVASNSGRRWTI